MYQCDIITARRLIDLGLSRTKDAAMKIWCYMRVLHMLHESWQPSHDQIAFTEIVLDLVDRIDDPSAFKWVGSKVVVEEHLFNCMFLLYMNENSPWQALKLAQCRSQKFEAGSNVQYSAHQAKICQAWALVEIGEIEEAVRIAEGCLPTLAEWKSKLPADSQFSENLFDHSEHISMDLHWVLGLAYTAKGQQKR